MFWFTRHSFFDWNPYFNKIALLYDHSHQRYERKVRPTKKYADGRQKKGK